MPLLREALDLQLPIRSQFKAKQIHFKFIAHDFSHGASIFDEFNKIRDVNKKNSLLGKNTQFLKSSISETAACTKFAWA
jgi:hypothetical protein